MRLLNRIYRFVKGFLSDFSGKEFLIFLFCLVLSGVFWLMMTLNETYEVEFTMPLSLAGVPKNVVMTSDLSDTVQVTLRDKGYVIAAYQTYNRLRPIRLNFSTYANKRTGHGKVPSADLLKYVRAQIYGSTTITSLKADRLEFYFNFGRNKMVKVKLVGSIVPANNYYLAHVQITPDVVKVYASKEILDKLGNVSTEELDISNFEDTVTRVVRLKQVTGAKIVPSQVKVTLFPDVLTEGSQEVTIKAVNKPDNIIIRTFPQTVTVKYNVGALAYRLVRPTDFNVYVDYNEIAGNPSDKCKVYLRSHSRFARNARLEISEVDYLIEQQ